MRARGLKYLRVCNTYCAGSVAPREGAWIEMYCSGILFIRLPSRPVRARGLKCRLPGSAVL